MLNINKGTYNVLSNTEERIMKIMIPFILGIATVRAIIFLFELWDVVVAFLNFVIWG